MAIPPGVHADPLDHLTRTRTSTRPPHPPHPTPCPYRTAYVSCCIRSAKFIRMQDAPSPLRSAPFIRRLGRKRPNGDDYPIQLAKFIRGTPKDGKNSTAACAATPRERTCRGLSERTTCGGGAQAETCRNQPA